MLPPCFAVSSRKLPPGVPTYACALTGAPVADYLSPAQLRDHVRLAYPYPFTPNRGSLNGLSGLTLPFTAFVVQEWGYYNKVVFVCQHFIFCGRKFRKGPRSPAFPLPAAPAGLKPQTHGQEGRRTVSPHSGLPERCNPDPQGLCVPGGAK